MGGALAVIASASAMASAASLCFCSCRCVCTCTFFFLFFMCSAHNNLISVPLNVPAMSEKLRNWHKSVLHRCVMRRLWEEQQAETFPFSSGREFCFPPLPRTERRQSPRFERHLGNSRSDHKESLSDADTRAPQRPPQQPLPLQGTTQQPLPLQGAPYIRPHRTDVGRPSARETPPAAATGRLIYETGAVDALDESVGRIVEALHRRCMLGNSFIVFTSDNGDMPWGTFSNTGSNWPLRGVKGTLWEGGVRVPALVWSPLLEPGSRVVMSRPVHLIDWLPTLYSAAGGRVRDLGTIDGLDLWPALSKAKSESAAIWPRKEFLINTDSTAGLAAYRDGNYKLVVITNRTSQTPNPFGADELQQHVPTPGGMPGFENEDAAVEHLDRLMKSSQAWKTLTKLLGRGGGLKVPSDWREKATVRCSREDPHLPGVELHGEGQYLFDIERDPCELNNLASRRPLVVDRLSSKLKPYTEAALPPLKMKVDPTGLPYVNDCVWAPWKDVAQTANRSCPCP
ncbi:arylsulfatase B-like isoform X2 [Dermacentor albipictus]|uniref:arylsulfatase B-like isoform X2 n=1 Tax=Dermacentor albipictus TaxID=60249 RepID=UPI0038FC6C87